MALWLWLEYTGYPNIICTMIQLSDSMVLSLSKEAIMCLDTLGALQNPIVPNDGGLPLTKILIQKHISLDLFIMKRYTAIAGIKSILNNICARIFKDILQTILSNNNTNRNYQHYNNYNNNYSYFNYDNYNYMNVASTSSRPSSSYYNYNNNSNRPLVVPGFPHPLFGDFTVPQGVEDLDVLDPRIWTNKKPSDDVTLQDKTMFLTFSRGFHVSKDEVICLFKRAYGENSVEELVMGNNNFETNHQPMFATLVVDGVEFVDLILKGQHLAKFRMNGKDIWARKYERRV
ncbi:hypothetical protein PIB30_051034 [Stylosanthes scabra]|uniref:Uncharacterized protein n=1 Tax=Stylosanthes scabra TaxID=79078 RepID=A0ABU6YH45_9FABA|nr:hypothetical protein [Stylosanthes scabra]